VLLPGVFSKELIQRVVRENGGDSDAALDVLLGPSSVLMEKVVEPPSVAPIAEVPKKAPSEASWLMDEDLAAAIAMSLEQQQPPALEVLMEKVVEPPSVAPIAEVPKKAPSEENSHMDEDLAAAIAKSLEQQQPPALEASIEEMETNEDIETSGWTVVDSEPKQATSNFVTDPEAPSWLPMLRTGGKDTSSAKLTFYDLQTQRLQAALNATPQGDSTSFTPKDLHGAGKGSGKSKGGG